MEAKKLFAELEKAFVKSTHYDDWGFAVSPLGPLVTEDFRKKSIGTVCDHTSLVTHVFTAVFPSNPVLTYVIATNIKDATLFVHHPAGWDLSKDSEVFRPMDPVLVGKMKENRVSIYCLHAPLDDFGDYSTGVSLAKTLGIHIVKPFAPYHGGLSGVIGDITDPELEKLKSRFESAVGHKVSLYPYSDSPKVANNRVALVPGGGNTIEVLEEVAAEGIDTFLTGVAVKNGYSEKAHEFARSRGINILGGTHYSTEKFACMAMCGYFEKLGIPAEFVKDEPSFYDL